MGLRRPKDRAAVGSGRGGDKSVNGRVESFTLADTMPQKMVVGML